MKNFLNNIPKNWKIIKFSDVAELRHGYQFRNYDFTEDGVKIFKITQIKGDGMTDISSCSFIDKNRLSQFNKFIINKGDILIALTGATIGKIARFNEDEIVLQNYRVGNFFPLNENILNKEYLYQFLKSNYFFYQILSNQTQSAQQNIGKEDINNMSVIFPPLQEQQSIASILTAIDDKIESNLAINKTLEEITMALYKHWFVDFGPFQNGEFVESELGLIPKGWEVKKITELIEVKDGTHDSPKRVDDGHFLITSKHMNGNSIDFNSAYKISNEDFVKINKRSLVEKGDILMTMIGTVGNFYFLNEEPNFVIKNIGLFKTSKKTELQSYFYSYFKSKIGREYIKAQMTGSTQQYVTLNTLRNFEIIIPTEKVLFNFNQIANDYFENIMINIKENQTLTQLRDTLLPKLISGEVRLKEFREN